MEYLLLLKIFMICNLDKVDKLEWFLNKIKEQRENISKLQEKVKKIIKLKEEAADKDEKKNWNRIEEFY